MTISVVRLGSDRLPDEGLRIGTVRRPPRGVKKADHATHNWYDVWLPALSPSPALVREALAAGTPAEWQAFVRRFQREMRAPDPDRLLTLLAALSRQSNFSVGCYCADEARCHRSVLRTILLEKGAAVR